MSYCCLDATPSLTLKYCNSGKSIPANDSYSGDQYARARLKQKRLYSDMGGGDTSLSAECGFLKDIPRKPFLQCSTNNLTFFPFSRWRSESSESLELHLDFISESVHQLDSKKSEVLPSASTLITFNRRALEGELEENKRIVTCDVSRTSSLLSSDSPLTIDEPYHGFDDKTVFIKVRDHRMPFTSIAPCSSYASLEFQLQYLAPNDPLGTCSVAPFVVFPNMRDPVFTTASYLCNRHQQTTDGLNRDFAREEASKECYGWFVELDQDIVEARTELYHSRLWSM